MFSIFDVAGSAMSAQSLRLNLTASNLANADSVTSSDGETYRARHPIFSAELDAVRANKSSIPVDVTHIVEDQSPLKLTYQPGHPLADEEGYVTMSNVNAIEEMANMISASRSYENNIDVLSTTKDLMLRTLRLGQ